MSYIKVDHSRLGSTADAVESYVELMKNKMRSADKEISALSFNWKGQDSNEYKMKWNTVCDDDSTYTKMMSSLKSYAGFLRYSAEKYKDAQTKAVNRANRLPRY